MKQKDIATILVIAFISAIFSILLSGKLFDSPKGRSTQVEVVQKITPDFPTPSTDPKFKKYFNEQSVNPTKLIQIGDNSNTKPFNQTQQ